MGEGVGVGVGDGKTSGVAIRWNTGALGCGVVSAWLCAAPKPGCETVGRCFCAGFAGSGAAAGAPPKEKDTLALGNGRTTGGGSFSGSSSREPAGGGGRAAGGCGAAAAAAGFCIQQHTDEALHFAVACPCHGVLIMLHD